MGNIVGETKYLKPSELASLQKLASKKINPRLIVSDDLAKRGAMISQELGVQIGVLVGRDGRIESLIVGTRERLYLPDLGRFRLDSARLRQIRLLVFIPEGGRLLKHFTNQSYVAGLKSQASDSEDDSSSGPKLLSPEIYDDFLTDLVKLRLDLVCVIAAGADGNPGAMSMAFLDPVELKRGSSVDMKGGERVGFYHARSVYEVDIDYEIFINDLETRVRATRQDSHEIGSDYALLVGAYTGSLQEGQASMDELKELARTAGINVVDSVMQRRGKLDPKTLVGKGKLEEIILYALDQGADLIIFDRELSPGQLRSISNLTELRIIDRSLLILDIFAQGAKSREGQLQVELAQLRYSLPRLTESDTGLSRLTGGIGGRGPGETKLEIGRRRVRDRITALEKKIDSIAQQRSLRRERRRSRGVPVIAVVGYTNAGKSTLLNALTKGDVLVEKKLFATLDPSTRRMRFPNDREVVFVDTVGFIRELPKELIGAFRATLEEIGEADLLVHLVDASNVEMHNQIEVVEHTLQDLGYGETSKILVLNKIDLLSPMEIKMLEQSLEALPISAHKGIGFERLLLSLQEELARGFRGLDPGSFTADVIS